MGRAPNQLSRATRPLFDTPPDTCQYWASHARGNVSNRSFRQLQINLSFMNLASPFLDRAVLSGAAASCGKELHTLTTRCIAKGMFSRSC